MVRVIRTSNNFLIENSLVKPSFDDLQIYVRDQSGQVPVLVRNKVAETLFANIIADDVSECYKNRHRMLLDTCESGNSRTSEVLDGTGKIGITKRKRTEGKLDFHHIWLILMKCLLNQGKNSPFCLQISVNPEKNVEKGRFELVSLAMPIPWDGKFPFNIYVNPWAFASTKIFEGLLFTGFCWLHSRSFVVLMIWMTGSLD